MSSFTGIEQATSALEINEHEPTDVYKVPHPNTCQRALEESILKDKPIKMEFYTNSLFSECQIVHVQDEEKVLYKSKTDYTSPIVHLQAVNFKNPVTGKDEMEIILETHNSLYIVHQNVDVDVLGNGEMIPYKQLLKSNNSH